MDNSTSVKLRTLYLMQILLQKTNEEHPLNATGLAKELEYYGMTIDRKTVYKDVEILRDFGLDVQQAKGTGGGYFIGSRDFELAELKVLVDTVQSSKFITSRKSMELIKKLSLLTNEFEARQLQRDVFIYNRIKSSSETIYYIVDDLQNAIRNNKQIRYKYGGWNMQKKLEPVEKGKEFHVSPWALTWSDGNYYLIGYQHDTRDIRHYRVDKIQKLVICDEPREGKEYFKNFDLALVMKKTFGMFRGKDEQVTLECDKSMIGVIIDRFGKECMLIPVDEEHFHVNTLISISPQFYGWLSGLSGKVNIYSPKHVREDYKKYLEGILKNYE